MNNGDRTLRVNPFDNELFVNEHHFEPSLFEVLCSSMDTQAATVADWELGLSPPGTASMGMTRMEELQLAIETCKEFILSSEEHSEKRRKLVAKLVQLRLQLQELKEGPVEVNDAERTICGHEFVEQQRGRRNPYCERCMGIVWRLVQPLYRCKKCGYRSHAKCLNLITRTCAAVVATNNPQYIFKICPQVGLASQKYRCAECKSRLAFATAVKEQEPRLCDYTGLFFCPQCHWNDEVVIPARVVHNWDFTPRLVSRSSKQLLEYFYRKPMIRLEQLNPTLANFVEELRTIKKLRQDILLMKCYFVCCRKARKQSILWNLARHQHFVENVDVYSMLDLHELQDGRLEAELRAILGTFAQHIRVDCESCIGNGFICELCSNKTVIFPFDDFTATCRMCCATFHRQCFETAERKCPRCQRRLERQLRQQHAENSNEL